MAFRFVSVASEEIIEINFFVLYYLTILVYTKKNFTYRRKLLIDLFLQMVLEVQIASSQIVQILGRTFLIQLGSFLG